MEVVIQGMVNMAPWALGIHMRQRESAADINGLGAQH